MSVYGAHPLSDGQKNEENETGLAGGIAGTKVQCVPLAIEPSISLIILTPMKTLQQNLNKSMFDVSEMKRNVSVVRLIVVTRSSSPLASQPVSWLMCLSADLSFG